MEEKTKKTYCHVGHSVPGLFKGTRYNVGVGKLIESTELIQHKGILYITNQRIIFQAKEQGIEPSTQLGVWFDTHYPDAEMKRIYPKAK